MKRHVLRASARCGHLPTGAHHLDRISIALRVPRRYGEPSFTNIRVSLNGDFDSVSAGTSERVHEIADAALEQDLRINEPIDDKPWGIRRFSLLDPSGLRVTVLAHIGPHP